jgi:glucose/arabinose dehydrogenase
VIPGASRLAVALVGAPAGAGLEVVNHEVCLRLPPLAAAAKFKVAIGVIPAEEDETAIRARLTKLAAPLDLEKLCHGGPALWPEPVVNSGTLGTGDGPYAVDTLTEPLPNPWNAKTFFGGFDFMPDGRMAVCTFHGDVWLVSGVDDKLAKLSWKRFATGLFQPLGVKVVDGKIYVLGRDQITIPHDLNGDGEADYYENFNNDTVVTPNYHEFCLDLQTDSKGNFYFAKGAPWPPVVTTPHQGTMIKVSKDGSQLEVIASGLRAPNGAAIGPEDQITVSDNQGHWIPSSKLNLIKPGAFYGMMPTAQRSPLPSDFEKPMFWLPMSMDNSSGGQAWVTSSKWGPFQNHLLFTSYGKSTLFHVMPQTVDGVTQAAVVQFPLRFNSGLMRCRFNPRDGQLYTCGLKGWQTSGTRDGGLYRVRYTGKRVYMPQDFKVEKGGVMVTFTTELNEASATGVENYALEQWDYKWSGDYGSPDLSVNAPGSKGHDIVGLKAAKLSADKKSVFLEISDFKPVMQMKIKFGINAADGTPMNQEIYSTIHRIPAN